MGRVRTHRAPRQQHSPLPPKVANPPRREGQQTLPPPPPPPHSHPAFLHEQGIDFNTFQPSQDTVQWLYTLPLPPGVQSQPMPQTSEDWALVEQFRLLCNGLTVMGEFERERRRRAETGGDPWADWDPRDSGNPHVISAAQSLFKHDLNMHAQQTGAPPPSQPQIPYPPHPHPANYPFSHYPGPSPYHPYPSPYHPYPVGPPGSHPLDLPDEYYSDEDDEGRSGSYRTDEEDDDDGQVFTYDVDFPNLASLQSFAGATPLDPAALPMSLDLSALTLGPNGIGELAPGEDGTPASLPSLMAAIAELEQCVARLSLEATEARNLQKSLREEMTARQAPVVAPSSAQQQQGGAANSALAGLARAGMRPMKRKVKGGRVVSVSSRARLPPHVQAALSARAGNPAPAAATPLPPPPPAPPAAPVEPHSPCDHDHCSDCGESLSPSSSSPPSPILSPIDGSGGAVQRVTHSAIAAAAAADQAALGGGGEGRGTVAAAAAAVGVGKDGKTWEDGELMKALQSVSLLDRRADEYRERLRVLKEQIHHHAAFADTLPSTAATAPPPSASPAPALAPPPHQSTLRPLQPPTHFPAPNKPTSSLSPAIIAAARDPNTGLMNGSFRKRESDGVWEAVPVAVGGGGGEVLGGEGGEGGEGGQKKKKGKKGKGKAKVLTQGQEQGQQQRGSQVDGEVWVSVDERRGELANGRK